MQNILKRSYQAQDVPNMVQNNVDVPNMIQNNVSRYKNCMGTKRKLQSSILNTKCWARTLRVKIKNITGFKSLQPLLRIE